MALNLEAIAAAAAREPFSSGDWTWRESDGYLHVEGPLGSLAIVFAESRTPNGGKTGVVGDEGEPNARLMSAAPRLLSALRDLADGVPDDALDACADNEVVTFTACAGELKRAKSALARAVGKAATRG